jgi:predicted transcriptional regulator
MLNLLSLDQLAHKASCEDNMLALAILDKLDDEIEQAVEKATETNDANYSYTIFDAVQAVEWLAYEAQWYKVQETKQTKDQIVYKLQGLHEDTNPYNNQVTLWKYEGSDVWRLDVNAGQYGESEEDAKFNAAGFKEAQQKATRQLVQWIKKGLELNV